MQGAESTGLAPARRRVVVVGAGIGGLAAAALLARAGAAVTVLEAAEAVGGKMRREVLGAAPEVARLDVGPTVLTLRRVFDALFAACGADFEAAVPLRPAELLARHAWRGGDRFDLYADRARTEAALADFAGASAVDGHRRFCAYATRILREVEGPFIYGPRPTPLTLVRHRGLRVFGALRHIDSFRSMWRSLGAFFPDPRLRQLYARYATYTGSSPFLAPATLNLVAQVEAEGVWQVPGGIHQVAAALARRVTALGGEIRLGARVAELEVRRGRAVGVVLASGEHLPAAAVVCNAAGEALARGHLGPAAAGALPRSVAPRPERRALSAVTWAVRAPVAGFDPAHHTVVFGDDYPKEFETLAAGHLPTSPTVYLCAQDRVEGETPPAAGAPERIFALVNAPALGDRPAAPGLSAEALAAAEAAAEAQLAAGGLRLGLGDGLRTTPVDFEARFPGTGGALYGAPTHGWRASLSRPGARTRLPGLYLCGGSAHPGPGVPMVALSGVQAARATAQDLGLSLPAVAL